MSTNRTTPSTERISVNLSQQTNQQPDPQQTIELLQAFVQQDISSRIDAMRPEIDAKVLGLVNEAKEHLVKEIQDSKIELQNVKNSVLGAVAVFAAFFTFVSVNVNIFSKSNAVESLALMIVMWICLMGFTYTFFLFLWDKWRNFKFWLPVLMGMIITCGILWFVKQPVESAHTISSEQIGR
jgi:cation transport ATPase